MYLVMKFELKFIIFIESEIKLLSKIFYNKNLYALIPLIR